MIVSVKGEQLGNAYTFLPAVNNRRFTSGAGAKHSYARPLTGGSYLSWVFFFNDLPGLQKTMSGI